MSNPSSPRTSFALRTLPRPRSPHAFRLDLFTMREDDAGPSASGRVLKAPRRQSRFDPMGDEDGEDYGELGQRHPLRRVQEERDEGVSLPSIKNLFNVAGERPSPGLHHSSSLPSLAPNSPSSSTGPRTSRYSSMGSTFSSVSDPQFGWWSEHERGSVSSAPPGPPRAHSYQAMEEHDAKRRRSDQPPSTQDNEEAARLRWQAQSRNASFPVNMGGLRSLIHPPHSAHMRASLSGPASPDEMRPPRSASIGGHLARSFADLSAADRSMAPPRGPLTTAPLDDDAPDRRQSLSERIMVQSGDARMHASFSEPGTRRESTDSASDGTVGRKRSVEDMRGMDVLAESAQRLAEDEPDEASSPGRGPKYTCTYCQKTFSRPSSLRIHTYSHTGERPFVCQEPSCGRRFSVQSNLKRHAKVHQLANQQAVQQHQAFMSSQQLPSVLQPPPAPPPPHFPPDPRYAPQPMPGFPPYGYQEYPAPPPPPPPPHGYAPGYYYDHFDPQYPYERQ